MIYHGEWTSREDMLTEVEWPRDEIPSDSDIAYAAYDVDGYEGWALLIFRRGSELFEVNDSHCSCHGLDNWVPEATSWDAIAMYENEYPRWPGLSEIVRLERVPAT
jgi:hypothetical protein